MDWYEDEVKLLESKNANRVNEACTVFYGSSSIRSWQTLNEDFPGYHAVNMGFGGSTMAACVWFFDRLFSNVTPTAIIIYAGDNDLGDGATAEFVFALFKELMQKIRNRFGNIPVGYISIKPSISRFNILDEIKKTNALIAADIAERDEQTCFINVFESMLDENGMPMPVYFGEDGLHINEAGYHLWTQKIYAYISTGELKME